MSTAREKLRKEKERKMIKKEEEERQRLEKEIYCKALKDIMKRQIKELLKQCRGNPNVCICANLDDAFEIYPIAEMENYLQNAARKYKRTIEKYEILVNVYEFQMLMCLKNPLNIHLWLNRLETTIVEEGDKDYKIY